MRWRRGPRSEHLEDARGRSLGTGAKLGVPGILVLLLAVFFGRGALDGGGGGAGDITDILERLPGAAPDGSLGRQRVPGAPDPDAKLVDFVSFVLDDVQKMWADQFAGAGRRYEPARLQLFSDATSTGCGNATSAVGPFYCPADQTAYLDLGFFRELSRRFDAPGDFAQAYVIAHELGHHVQHVLGIDEDVRRAGRSNELSIRQELQADCFAGIWGHSTYERGILESGDLEEGLAAASAVGDDRIQEQAGGGVNRETWTHGSAAQRSEWFRRGFDSGDPGDCDTFS